MTVLEWLSTLKVSDIDKVFDEPHCEKCEGNNICDHNDYCRCENRIENTRKWLKSEYKGQEEETEF